MTDQNRLGLKLAIDYSDTSGVYQIDSVAANNGKYDFIVTANAPFYLYGDKYSSVKNYRHCFEIHGEEQVLLRRKSLRKSKYKRMHVFANSSAEEQFLIRNEVYSNTEKYSHKYYEELVKVIRNLDVGDIVIAWEPLATYLSQSFWIKRSEDVFYNWISLFQHKRWNNRNLKAIGNHLKLLFIYEWLYCKSSKDRAANLLLQDEYFKDRFKLGSGIDLPIDMT